MANTKVTGDLIASSTIATGNIADNAVTSAKISGITTAHITEGSNLYYTDARARASVSVSGNALSYNSSTGVITSNFEESPTFTGDITMSKSTSGGLYIKTTSNVEPFIAIQRNSGSNGVAVLRGIDGGHLYIDTGATGAGQATKMVIQAGGNVGIGATSPSYKLQVNGTSYINETLYVNGNTTIDANLDITSGGRVKVSGSNTDQYYFEGQRNGVGVTYRLYDNSNNVYHDSWTSQVFRLNQNGGSGGNLIITGGNVGIGTSSPSANLHVQNASTATLKVITTGVADASVNIQGYDAGVHIGDATNGLRWAIWNDGPSTSSSLKFGSYALGTWYNNSSQVVTMTSDGKVGIGVTDPEKKLEIKSDTTYDGILIDTLSAPEINFRDRGNSDTLVGTGRHALDGFHIDTYSGNAFFIKGSNRHVGIGTTSPARPLHVNGLGTVARFQGSQTGYTQGSIVLHSGTADSPSARGQGTYRYNEGSDICWYTGTAYNNTNKYIWARRASITSFATDAGEGTAQVDYALMTLVGSSGDVGIGTASPSSAFHVKSNAAILYAEATGVNQNSSIWLRSNVGGTIADRFEIGTNIGNGADLEIYSRQDSATRFLIESGTGRIGIGTTAPSTKLDVRNDDGVSNGLHLIADFSRAGGADAQLILGYFANGSAVTGPVVYAANNMPLLFSSGSTEKMRIDTNGFIYNPTMGAGSGEPSVLWWSGSSSSYGQSGMLIRDSSSRVFKKNERASTIDTSKIFDLELKQFEWNEKSVTKDRTDFGLIAEDVDEILPELVVKKNNEYFTVRYNMIGILAVQELKKANNEIELLKEEIEQLKIQINGTN